VLGGIHDNIARLTSYNDNITQAFQKKSLELQMRSFFVQKELVDYSRKYQEVTTKQFDIIAKNTALPEFLKIHKNELFREELAKRTTGKIADKLFGKNNFVDNFFNRLTPYIGQKVSEISEGIQQGVSGIEMVEMGMDMNSQMGGSNAQFFGEQLGAMGINSLRNLLTPELRKQLEKEFPDLKMTGEKWQSMIANPYKYIDKLKKSQDMKNGLQSNNFFKRFLFETFDEILDMGNKTGPEDRLNAKKLFASDVPGAKAQSDSSMLLSVTEIIPGYLSRIHQELRMTRTQGRNSSLLVYDQVKGEFKTQSDLDAEIQNSIKEAVENRSYGFNRTIADITDKILGEDADEAEREEFKQFLADFATGKNNNTSLDSIIEDDDFKKMSSSTRAKVAESIFRKMEAEGNRDRFKASTAFTNEIDSIRGATPDVQDVISKYLEAGQDKALINAGIIKMNSDGKYTVVMDKYLKFIKDTTAAQRIATSDVNTKTNISKYDGRVIPGFNGRSILSSMKNVPIFNWNYKQGLGEDSNSPKIGPMAQDVKRNLGEEAAPDGRKIDLVTMNGMNMAAIQEVNQKVDDLSKLKSGDMDGLKEMAGTQTEYLRLISEHTKTSLDKLDALGKLTILSIPGLTIDKNFFGSFGDSAVTAGRLVKDAVLGTGRFGLSLAGKVTKGTLSTIGTGVNKIYESRDKIDKTVRTVGNLGKDLIMNVGEMGYKGLERITSSVFKGAGAVLGIVRDVFIDADIYVKGEAMPKIKKILAESGEYYDKASGTVIKKYSDIKGEVVDKAGNIILSNADIIRGLVDIKGRSIKSSLRNLYTGGKTIVKFGAKVLGAVASGAWQLANKAFKSFDTSNLGIGFGNKKILDTLNEIKDILKNWGKKKKRKGEKDSETTEQVVKEGTNTGGTEKSFSALRKLFDDTDQGKQAKGLLSKVGGYFGIGDQKTTTEQDKKPVKKEKDTREERLANIAKRKEERKTIKEQAKFQEAW
jgi:hypothetical protein